MEIAYSAYGFLVTMVDIARPEGYEVVAMLRNQIV